MLQNNPKQHHLLVEAILSHLKLLSFPPLPSLYFGGGTPYLLPPDKLELILQNIPSLTKTTEITLEANPEDITLDSLKAFRKVGINRLSIGVQSLDDSLLHKLGRNHSAAKASEAVHLAEKAGFTNISIDLMFDLPSQTVASWEKTLSRLAELPISHLSLYNLTIEPHTPFYKKKKELLPTLPTEEESLLIWDLATEKLSSLGLHRYEISAFAKPSYESIHNSGYWTGRPFAGVGPSAFSYLDGKRLRTPLSLPLYQKLLESGSSPYDFTEELPYPNNLHELLAIRLRLLRGLDLPTFEKTYSPLPQATHHTLTSLQEQGFLTSYPLRLTEKGIRFYDDVATALI